MQRLLQLKLAKASVTSMSFLFVRKNQLSSSYDNFDFLKDIKFSIMFYAIILRFNIGYRDISNRFRCNFSVLKFLLHEIIQAVLKFQSFGLFKFLCHTHIVCFRRQSWLIWIIYSVLSSRYANVTWISVSKNLIT